MKLLFIINHFYPEVGAIRTEYELSRKLASMNHKITVLTTFPRKYRVPHKSILKKYKTKKFLHAESILHGKMRIIRVKSFTSPSDTISYRILELISSIISLSITSLILPGSYDAVLTAGDLEFLASIPGIVYKSIKGTCMATIVHDIHPKALIDTGVIKNKFIIRILHIIERFFYAKTDRMIVHSEGNKKLLAECGADFRKIEVVYLWADLNLVKPATITPPFRKKFKNKFIVSFAGVMHYLQGLEVVIEAAKLLREHKDIIFILVGEGPVKPLLMKRAQEYKLNNIIFMPLLPKDKYVELLQSSNVSLVTLRRGYTQPVIPSKLIEIMAAGCPVILCTPKNNDAVKIVQRAKCGIWVEAGNAKELANAILILYNNREKAREMGINGRKFAEKHFSLEIAAQKYEKILKNLINQTK